MTRKNFSKAVLVARHAYAGGLCEWIDRETSIRCNAVLVPGQWHGDHDNPDGLTGEPTFENCRALCLHHHAMKTKLDVAAIAKAKRREAAHIGARTAPAKSIASAPMPQTAQARDREAKRRDNPKLDMPARRPMFK